MGARDGMVATRDGGFVEKKDGEGRKKTGFNKIGHMREIWISCLELNISTIPITPRFLNHLNPVVHPPDRDHLRHASSTDDDSADVPASRTTYGRPRTARLKTGK